jgi:hypothetical protein
MLEESHGQLQSMTIFLCIIQKEFLRKFYKHLSINLYLVNLLQTNHQFGHQFLKKLGQKLKEITWIVKEVGMKKQCLHFQELQFFGIVLYLMTQLCLQQYRQQIRINIL